MVDSAKMSGIRIKNILKSLLLKISGMSSFFSIKTLNTKKIAAMYRKNRKMKIFGISNERKKFSEKMSGVKKTIV